MNTKALWLALWLPACYRPTGLCVDMGDCAAGQVCVPQTHTCAALRTVAVTRAGPGSGVVVSDPPGIQCSATCSASFPQGSPVHLSAQPFAGSQPAGWSAPGCAGAACAIIPGAGGARVTATFGLASWQQRLATTPQDPLSEAGVWGSGPGDVWAAAGEAFSHYDGTQWNPVSGTSGQGINAIWGSAASDVWAVGDQGPILHYTEGPDRPPRMVSNPTDKALFAIWGSGPMDIWAAGDSGTLLHYDGGDWTDTRLAMGVIKGDALASIWGSGPGDVWLVGTYAYHHVNGAWSVEDWSTLPMSDRPDADAALSYVWGSGPKDVWIVGHETVTRRHLVLHFDGKGWATEATLTSVERTAIWGSGPDNVWLAGSDGSLLHGNGTGWSAVQPAASMDRIVALGGTGTRSVWAITQSGLILGPPVLP